MSPTCGGCCHPHSYSPLSLAAYQLERRTSRRSVSPSGSHTFIDSVLVQDYLPDVHRSAQAALALGPTNPPRITRAAEPSGFRWWGFAPHFSVTHSDIRTRRASTVGFRYRFAGHTTLPYRWSEDHPRASAVCFAPLDCRRRDTRPVSCYALFQGWLLLSQPPGCLSIATSFPTQHTFGGLSCGSGLLPF